MDIDLKSFFDNVNHGKLLKQIWSLGIRDKKVISIISKMLKAKSRRKAYPPKEFHKERNPKSTFRKHSIK